MAKFWIGFSEFTTSTTPLTAMKLIGASAKAFEICEVGCYGGGQTAAADTQHEIQMGCLSNAGAGTPGTSPTPEKVEQYGTASGLTAGTAYTAEPTTYTTNVFPLFTFNQRAGMRWAVPRGDGMRASGADTYLSAGVRVDSSAAGKISGNMFWWE